MNNTANHAPAHKNRLCINAGWIVTVDADNSVFKNHSLIIENSLIIDCLPTEKVDTQYPNIRTAERRNHILMPGLINAHTHLAMNLLRGLGSDQPLMTWLNDYIWPAEQQHMSEAFVRDGTRLAIAESLLSGVTTVNDMYFYPAETARVCEQAGMRASVGLTVLEFPTAWARNASEYISKGLEVHAEFSSSALINTILAPHAPYTVSVPTLERIRDLSAELSLPVHMHVHETHTEVENYQREHGVRPIEQLEQIGLLSPSLLAVHLTQLTDNEIERLAMHGVHALHCPESNLKLASGFCPISALNDAGVNIAMGTDGAASNNDLDLLGETRTAALLAKAVSGNAASINAVEALRMATINGARALQIDHLTGSLEAGKCADVIAIEVDLTLLPMPDVISQIVYAAGRERISDVWIDGQQVVHQRELQTLDAKAITNQFMPV